MRTFKILNAARLWAGPLVFSAIALGLATVHVSMERKAERARMRAAAAAERTKQPVAAGLLNTSLRDVTIAANSGDLAARTEMGRRFALGLGVRKNEARAVGYFQSVIDELRDIGAHDGRSPYLATALRFMAKFQRAGVAEANIGADPANAFSMLHQAASYLGDAAAQFEIGMVLLTGDGVPQNRRAAAQWFLRASRKGYAPAQARLGEQLWLGDGVRRAAGDGLGLLALARQNAQADDKVWISKMFETARSAATPAEILEANAFIVQEASTPRFGAAITTDIEGRPAMGTPPAEGSGTVASNRRQGSLIQAPMPKLPALTRNPLGIAPSMLDPELTNEIDDVSAPAGIIQMYQPADPERRSALDVSVKLAGISR